MHTRAWVASLVGGANYKRATSSWWLRHAQYTSASHVVPRAAVLHVPAHQAELGASALPSRCIPSSQRARQRAVISRLRCSVFFYGCPIDQQKANTWPPHVAVAVVASEKSLYHRILCAYLSRGKADSFPPSCLYAGPVLSRNGDPRARVRASE